MEGGRVDNAILKDYAESNTAASVTANNDSYTKLLLHCDGADASTTFTDSSPSAHTVTANGNAQIDTAQSKFGGASGLFDGTDDYLNLDGSSDFAFGTGDFTVDFWVRLNALSSTRTLYDSRPLTTNGDYLEIAIDNLGSFYITDNSAIKIQGTTIANTGVWYHIAVTRSGTSMKLFVNGVQEGSTYTSSINYLVGTNRPTIGTAGTVVTVQEVDGWFDEIRVSKGIARWTSNFTPPPAAHGATSYDVDLASGNVFDLILTDSTIFTFSNPTASGTFCSFMLLLKQDGTGSRTATWPAAVIWPAATAPTLTTTASKADVLYFFTVTGGGQWAGKLIARGFSS